MQMMIDKGHRWLRRFGRPRGGSDVAIASTISEIPRQSSSGGGAGWARSGRQIRVLLIPANAHQVCEVQPVAADAGEMDRQIASQLISGDAQAAYRWTLYSSGRDVAPGACRIYLDGDRVTRRLPPNERATQLGARLGNIDREMQLLGTVLVVGIGLGSSDVDVPHTVVSAARRTGLLINDGYTPEPGRESST